MSIIFIMGNEELKDSFETDIKLIGDKGPITQIIILLAYIRHYLQNNESGEIKITIGKKMKTDFFAMQVNDQEIPGIFPEESIEIN